MILNGSKSFAGVSTISKDQAEIFESLGLKKPTYKDRYIKFKRNELKRNSYKSIAYVFKWLTRVASCTQLFLTLLNIFPCLMPLSPTAIINHDPNN